MDDHVNLSRQLLDGQCARKQRLVDLMSFDHALGRRGVGATACTGPGVMA
jgi:hypothetical protein